MKLRAFFSPHCFVQIDHLHKNTKFYKLCSKQKKYFLFYIHYFKNTDYLGSLKAFFLRPYTLFIAQSEIYTLTREHWFSGSYFCWLEQKPGCLNSRNFANIFEDLFIKEGFSGFHDRRNAAELTGEDVETKITIDLADSYTGADRLMTLDIGRGRTRTFNVKIPKGILSGQKIRLSGQGVPDIGGGMPGDLFLQVFFRESMQYRIDEADVFCRLHVSPWEAALGAPVIFPLLGGRQVELKIPRNSSGGQKLRLEGCGIPASPPGDLFIELVIVLPKADSENARHALEIYVKISQFKWVKKGKTIGYCLLRRFALQPGPDLLFTKQLF